ncbi:hypothetical protein SMD44_p10214 (plasmid) [Streptomyces alboflavus]|uniref:Uncharacterized protein n=1 Tax=Streptomyces alboflavus TaxID=67267 RepID=A0A291W482_9ACTN|nr:hypothetical protein [Streptomyces alboflavus]ATM24713.1 hypothetical protein SMD44_p10214 [Streptomyces alboflavus]
MAFTELSDTALTHLRKASADPDGHLPSKVGPKLLRLFLMERYAYRNDADGYVLPADDALKDLAARDGRSRPSVITVKGRRAVLNEGQFTALSQEVDQDGRLSPTVPWPTVDALVRLQLVQRRDEAGRPKPDGTPFRTEFGDDVANIAKGIA